MKALPIARIAEHIGAAFSGGDRMVCAISTDTRTMEPGCLFVALRGENFDGNDYVVRALEQGAAFAVAERMPAGVPPERILLVNDGRVALMHIANLHRESLGIKVIAVTGSVGKTTTKEMVDCTVSAGFKTYKTQQNLNNEIGLSQTILQLEEGHQAAVLEMAMDGPGQMQALSLCARPDIAIVTNIGMSHIEKFADGRAGILREKMDVTAGMNANGLIILNADDELLSGVAGTPQRVLRYGIDARVVDARALHIKAYSTHTTFEIEYNENRFDAQVPAMGRHNVSNALAAFLAAVRLGVEPRLAVAALKSYRPVGMRQNVVKHGELTIVEDCYNASPDSMRAALATLAGIACEGRRIAVLSDMLELGDIAPRAHYEIGKYAASCGITALLCTGELSQEYVRAAKEAGMKNAKHFSTQSGLFDSLRQIVRPGDVIWFKASRGMKLEKIIQKVYEVC